METIEINEEFIQWSSDSEFNDEMTIYDFVSESIEEKTPDLQDLFM